MISKIANLAIFSEVGMTKYPCRLSTNLISSGSKLAFEYRLKILSGFLVSLYI